MTCHWNMDFSLSDSLGNLCLSASQTQAKLENIPSARLGRFHNEYGHERSHNGISGLLA